MKSTDKSLYITGGRSHKDGSHLEEWNRFEAALLLRLDLKDLSCTTVLDYQSPPQVCPEESQSHVFKAGHQDDNYIYLCTSTEILVLDATSSEIHRKISLPSFNDLHHVRPDGSGDILTVSTGLDLVTRVTLDGRVLDEWSVYGDPVWERHNPATDYRKVLSTKPHPSHPNFVFLSGGKVWATRHFQKDAICLESPDLRLNIEVEKPHDGILHQGSVYFTTVDGHVVEIDEETKQTVRVVDLRDIYGSRRPLGFCRGLHVLDKDRIIVGFSRLRKTNFQRNISWVKDQIKQASILGNNRRLTPLETRVALIDTARKTVAWEVNLEDYGLHAVFSIF